MDVIMPQLGETVAEGVVTKWYKRVGDTVKADETLFAHEALDFLDVCTPPALHEEGILQACAHGLHVLCEKPLTFTAPALQRIMAAASAANILVFAVHNWKYAPIFQALKRLRYLTLVGTRVTDDGVAELQRALPNCRIDH